MSIKCGSMTWIRFFWERLGFEEKSEKCCYFFLSAGQLLLNYWFQVAMHQHFVIFDNIYFHWFPGFFTMLKITLTPIMRWHPAWTKICVRIKDNRVLTAGLYERLSFLSWNDFTPFENHCNLTYLNICTKTYIQAMFNFKSSVIAALLIDCATDKSFNPFLEAWS